MKVHFEPYVYLAALTHKSALVAWGGFYFKVSRTEGGWRLMDDEELDHVHPPRSQSIGATSFPYGHARVEVLDETGVVVGRGETRTANHVWIPGLEPDTAYRYHVTVNGHEWAAGPRRDWATGTTPGTQGLVESGRAYDNRFRTHPHPETEAALTFAALGDFGTGVRRPSTDARRQREVAAALERAVDAEGVRLLLTTGDNIYAGRTLLGIPVGATGDEDDDWFFTYYQPYRYVINRIPVHPCIGNHDGEETEANDDRDQITDNFYLTERLLGEEAAGRASIGPGLFYRFRYGSQRSSSAWTPHAASCCSASGSSGTSIMRPSSRPPSLPPGLRARRAGASLSPTTRPIARVRSGGTRTAASSTWCRSTGARECASC